jgi:DNA gyrase/topoisomerase IV subunit A
MSQFNVSNENKSAILSQRLVELNAEGYSNELAIVQAEAINNAEQIAQFEANVEVIKAAIAAIEKELDKLA